MTVTFGFRRSQSWKSSGRTTKDTDDESPRIRDKYRLGGILGVGAFSVVRQVVDFATEQKWACKVISLNQQDGTPVDVLMREVEVMVASGHHDNVLGLREYFVESGRLYIIMDRLAGGDLDKAVAERGSISEGDARDIFSQLLAAVEHLHSRNVVHRDIKLENVMLVREGDLSHVKLCDFGMSLLCSSAEELSELHTICGTPAYISPEVAHLVSTAKERASKGDRKSLRSYTYGCECDLWACGVALFIMLTGYPPFHSSTIPSLLASIKSGIFHSDDPSWDLLSDDAKDLIEKLLDPNPESRLTAEEALAHPWLLADPEYRSSRATSPTSSICNLPLGFE
jgi:serine/threonine protein kinase